MKKLSFLLLSLSFFVINVNYAQNDPIVQSGSSPKFRFGLCGSGSVDWLEPQNQKKFTSGGKGFGYGWGPQIEIKIFEKTTLRTGFNLYSSAGSINYSPDDLAFDSVYFFLDPDENYVEWDDAVIEDAGDYIISSSNNSLYQLKKRDFRSKYVNIPLSFKMKTNEIGYMTFFGEFGSVIGFNTSSLSNDECIIAEMEDTTGIISIPSATMNDIINKSNIDFNKGTQPIKAGLVVGGGGEFTFSGTTALFFAVHFMYDFTNVVRSDKREPYLRRMYNDSYERVGANSSFRSVRLTLGILF